MPAVASFTINMLTREQLKATAKVGHRNCFHCTNPITYHVALTNFAQGDPIESAYLCDDHGVKLLDDLDRVVRRLSRNTD
jgi:hypothetical protein